MIDQLVQTYILVVQIGSFSYLAVADPKVSRWGYPIGLAAQPAYFYACGKAEQWGMFVLTAYIALTLAYGTYNRFWRKA